MEKAITIYTPPASAAHITAEDDAFIHDAVFGRESGIIGGLMCEKVNDNVVRLFGGGVSNRGYIMYIPDGYTHDLPVATGPVGMKRQDLVTARFVRGGGSTPDTHVFNLVQGTPFHTSGTNTPPSLTGSDLSIPGSVNEIPLFWVHLNGTTITSVERYAADLTPTKSDGKHVFVQSQTPLFPDEGDLWFW